MPITDTCTDIFPNETHLEDPSIYYLIMAGERMGGKVTAFHVEGIWDSVDFSLFWDTDFGLNKLFWCMPLLLGHCIVLLTDTGTPCVSLLSEGYPAGNGSAPSAKPAMQYWWWQRDWFCCILSMSVIDDGKEHKLVLILRKMQSSSDVNLSELRSV